MRANIAGVEQSLFDIKLQNGTCSIQEIRLPIFAPLSRTSPKSAIYNDFLANKRTRIVETSWGKVQVKGSLLTQVHKDLLDLIILNADRKKITSDGRLLIEFSTNKVLKSYGDKGENYKWFRAMLEDIMGSVISLETSDKKGFAFHIISAMKYDDNKEFMGILLSSEYLKFYKESFAVNYNREIVNLIGIESSIIKSIVRFFLSHTSLNISTDDLFKAVGVKADKKDRFYRHIKQLIAENEETLRKFGITLENDIFYYKGNSNVKFYLN